MVAIQRRDTLDWAIPGGMVDAGEHVSVAVKREFSEEAGNITDPDDKKTFERLAAELFANGRVIYKGYVDEHRNTDNAWIETTVFHFHCGPELGRLLPLEAGDDAGAVRWFDILGDGADKLYPPHRSWVKRLAQRLSEQKLTEENSVTIVNPENLETASLISYSLSSNLSEAVLRRSFDVLDEEKVGYLTMEQLAKIFSQTNTLPFSIKEGRLEAEQVIAIYSKTGDGMLHYPDFVTWWEVSRTEQAVARHKHQPC